MSWAYLRNNDGSWFVSVYTGGCYIQYGKGNGNGWESLEAAAAWAARYFKGLKG